MLIVMKADATKDDVASVEARIRELGFTPNEMPGSTRLAIGITGNQGPLDPGLFNVMSGVADAVPISQPWKLVSREVKPDDTAIKIGGGQFGGGHFGVIAGPCAVESREQIDDDRRGGQDGGRALPARRRVQAAHVALRVPGHEGRRPGASWPRRAPRPACRSSPR